MNTSPLKSAALVALCLVQAPLIAAPPAFVTEEEIAALKAEAASVKPEADKIKASTEANLAESITEGDKASDAALKFIKTSEIKAIAEDSPGKEPEAKPLEVKPGPDDTLITCEGGMYFDADEGVLVYLKNVKVTDPRFNLVAGGQLKVFFDKKPEKKKKPGDKEKKAEEQAGPANFGDVKKLVAEGAVVLDQKGVGGKDPVKASGSILTYDVPEGEIIIHGGYPWVKQGTYYARAMEPDLTLRLLNDGSFSTKGNWQMGGNMNLKGQ